MKTLNLLQLIFEIIVAVGYAVGLIPFMYLFTVWFVVPLTVADLVFSILTKNKTMPFTITNVVMAFLSLIPLVGYVTRIVGIVMSIISAVKVGKLKN